MDDPVSWQIKRVKALKKRSLEFNIPSLGTPVLHGILFLLFVGYTGTGIITTDVLLNGNRYDIALMSKIANYLPIIIAGVVGVTVFDRIVVGFMYYIRAINKATAELISRIDHVLWKRTKKDAPLSTAILKFYTWLMQQPKFIRFLILYGLPIYFVFKHVLALFLRLV